MYANKTEFILAERDTNVLEFDRVATDFHPTQKPIDLFAYLIKKSTVEGETVLDPFAGSGTTALAANQLGRHYILIEKEPKYVEIARKRLSQDLLFRPTPTER